MILHQFGPSTDPRPTFYIVFIIVCESCLYINHYSIYPIMAGVQLRDGRGWYLIKIMFVNIFFIHVFYLTTIIIHRPTVFP